MRGQPERTAVEQALRQAFRNDRAKVDVAPLSQFCVGELARQRRGRTLAEIQLDEDGQLSVETCALAAIRRLEAEARAQRSRKLVLQVPADVHAWLEADTIGWNGALAERIGARFTIALKAEFDREECGVKS